MVGVGSGEDGGVDIVALGGIVLASNDDLDVLVGLGLVNGTRELLEGSLVDNRSVEVVVLSGVANAQLLDLGNQLLLELSPLRLGDIKSGSSTALLTLVLESTSDGLLDGVVDVGGRVDQVEVLTTGLANNSGVATVSTLADTLADGGIELSEHGGAASVVEGSEFLVLENNLGNLNGVTRDKLNDILRETSLEEDLVDQPVGSDGKVTGLPDNNVAQERRGSREVTGDGSEVERADGVNETLERSVLEPVPDGGGVVHGLGAVQLLSVVDVEAEEVSKLGSRVDLGLPGVLALAEHGRGHDFVAVLGGDEVGGLEEDGSSVGKGERLPGGLGREGGVNGLGDIGGGRGVVRGDGGGVVGGVDLLGDGGALDLRKLSAIWIPTLLLTAVRDIPPCLQRQRGPRGGASSGSC